MTDEVVLSEKKSVGEKVKDFFARNTPNKIVKRYLYNRKINKRKRLSRSFAGDLTMFLLLAGFALFSIYPLVFTINNAFKPLDELFMFPPRLFVRRPTLNNFTDLAGLMGGSWVPFSRFFFNTILITVVGTFGHVVFASMAAYPLAKHRFPGKTILFALVVYSLMFAPQVTMVPRYIIFSQIGLLDNLLALILPAFAASLGLYLMRQFMVTIPTELIESAKIDGASEFRILFTIVMPLVKPAWLTLIILLFQSLWTADGAMFIFSEELRPVSFALSLIVAGGVGRAGASAAVMLVMMIVPVTIFVFSQSKIIETMSHSGMK